MPTCTSAGLEELLDELGLSTPVPEFPGARVLFQPIDIWRSYLADTTSKVLDCDATLAYQEAVQNSNSKDNGDLVLILPKLRLKTNNKPKELANESITKARHCNHSASAL